MLKHWVPAGGQWIPGEGILIFTLKAFEGWDLSVKFSSSDLSVPGVECTVNEKGNEQTWLRTPDRKAYFSVPFLGVGGGFVLFWWEIFHQDWFDSELSIFSKGEKFKKKGKNKKKVFHRPYKIDLNVTTSPKYPLLSSSKLRVLSNKGYFIS